MLKSGNSIRVFNSTEIANTKSFFTGSINEKSLNFDPLITGYSFILWTKLPKWLLTEFPSFAAMTQKNFINFDGIEDMELTTADYIHTFNENNHITASSITKNNQGFTITHKEYSGSPIGNMYKFWVSSIRDPRTGIATYPKKYGVEYTAANHTAELLYIVTRPDVNNTDKKNVEFAAYYTNVLPTKIQLSHFNHSLGQHETVDYQERFTATMHIGQHVDNYAAAKLKETYSFVAEGMFDPDPENPDIAQSVGNNITEFTIDDSTSLAGTGNGYLI